MVWWALAGAFALTWLLYHPALTYGFINYDDPHFVRDNPQLAQGLTWESWNYAWTANLLSPDRRVEYWMPLTQLSRLVDFQCFGADGRGHHFQSVLFHAVNAWLVFLLFARATRAPGRSAAVALLWLVHPLNVEPVAWVALRKDVLAGTFALLTLLAWVRHGRHPTRKTYLLALLAFVGAILCKPSVVALPALLLLLDWWPLCRPEWEARGSMRPRAWGRLLGEKIPFVLLAVAVSWLTEVNHEDLNQGGGRYDYEWIDRIRQMLAGYSFYVQKALLPDQLCILYPNRPPAEISALDVRLGIILLGCLSLGFGWLAWRGRRAYLMGWLWFVGMLLPVSGIVQFGRQSMADRYAYIPLVGFLAAGVWIAADLAAVVATRRGRVRLRPHPAWSVGGILLAVGIAVPLAGKSWVQLGTWRDDFALWTQALGTERDSVTAFTNYGTALANAQFIKPSGAALAAGLKIAPDNPEQQGHLGIYHAAFGAAERGVQLLDAALRVTPFNMRYHTWLIRALTKLDRADDVRFAKARMEAIRGRRFLRMGLQMLAERQPEDAREQFALASSAWLGLRRSRPSPLVEVLPADAWVGQFRERMTGQPASADTRALLEGYAAFLRSETAAAAEIFRGIAARQPTWAEPRWRLALCLMVLGQEEEAAREAEAAASCSRMDPEGAADWRNRLDATQPEKPAPTAAPMVTFPPVSTD